MRSPIRIVAVVVALAAVLWGRSYFSDAGAIRRMFGAMASSIADESILGLAGNISRSYSDPYGHSYESLLGAVHQVFTSYDDLRLTWSAEHISVSGTTATVTFAFRLYGTQGSDSGLIVGEALTPGRAQLELRKRSGSWIIERAVTVEIPNAPTPGTPPG